MRVRILNRYWKIQFCPNLGENTGGVCDYDKSTIRVWAGLRGEELVRVIFHEILHAACEHLTEEFVDSVTEDAARIVFSKTVWERVNDA